MARGKTLSVVFQQLPKPGDVTSTWLKRDDCR